METNKIVTLAVMLAVVVVIMGSLLVPIVNDAATENYTNESSDGIEYIYSDSFTLSKEADSADLTVNSTEFATTGSTNLLLVSDDLVINQANSSLLIILSDGTATNITSYALTATCTDGSFAYTIGTEDEVTVTLSNPMIAVTDGDYVSINTNDDVYVSGTSDIIAWGYTSGTLCVWNGSETITSPDDYPATFNYTIEDNQIAKSDITFTFNSRTAACNTLIVPESITIDNEYAMLYYAIPTILVAGLIVACVRVALGGKD